MTPGEARLVAAVELVRAGVAIPLSTSTAPTTDTTAAATTAATSPAIASSIAATPTTTTTVSITAALTTGTTATANTPASATAANTPSPQDARAPDNNEIGSGSGAVDGCESQAANCSKTNATASIGINNSSPTAANDGVSSGDKGRAVRDGNVPTGTVAPVAVPGVPSPAAAGSTTGDSNHNAATLQVDAASAALATAANLQVSSTADAAAMPAPLPAASPPPPLEAARRRAPPAAASGSGAASTIRRRLRLPHAMRPRAAADKGGRGEGGEGEEAGDEEDRGPAQVGTRVGG